MYGTLLCKECAHASKIWKCSTAHFSVPSVLSMLFDDLFYFYIAYVREFETSCDCLLQIGLFRFFGSPFDTYTYMNWIRKTKYPFCLSFIVFCRFFSPNILLFEFFVMLPCYFPIILICTHLHKKTTLGFISQKYTAKHCFCFLSLISNSNIFEVIIFLQKSHHFATFFVITKQ